MASSNIKLFDENKGNMLTDTEFNISAQRLNGLQTGVASSQLQNKAMYQASLMAYAIAQVMMQNGLNANDTDAVSTFVANLSGTMLQKVYDIATTEEAKAGVATGKWMSPALVKAAIDKTLSDNDFLKKSGDTMTGSLCMLMEGTYAEFFNTSGSTFIRTVEQGGWDDRRTILIKTKTGEPDFNKSLTYARSDEGWKEYVLLHTGNAQSLGFSKIATGSYVGTGTAGQGQSTATVLTFNFAPKFLILVQDEGALPEGTTLLSKVGAYSIYGYSGFYHFYTYSSGFACKLLGWGTNTLSYYTNGADATYQFNASGKTYYYMALG